MVDNLGGNGHDSWIYQGRQAHGWFGHGTAPGGPPNDLGETQSCDVVLQRIRDIGHTLVAGLPASKRYHPGIRLDDDDRARLSRLLAAVVQALPLGLSTIARRIFGKDPDTPGIDDFVQAAGLLRNGQDGADLRAATDALGKAAQDIGLDHFKSFLHQADEHLAERGGLAVLVRDLPVAQPPAPEIPGRVTSSLVPPLRPWGPMIAGIAALALQALVLQAQDQDVRETVARFGLDPRDPNDVLAAHAYLWAERIGPWVFDTPQTGSAMQNMAELVMWTARDDPDLFRRAASGDPDAQRQVTAMVVVPPSGSGIETQTDDERDLVAQWVREGRSATEIQSALDAWRRSGGRLTAKRRRNLPGVAMASTVLRQLDGPSLSALMKGDEGAPIPGQVADILLGRRFSSLTNYERLFRGEWQEIQGWPRCSVNIISGA